MLVVLSFTMTTLSMERNTRPDELTDTKISTSCLVAVVTKSQNTMMALWSGSVYTRQWRSMLMTLLSGPENRDCCYTKPSRVSISPKLQQQPEAKVNCQQNGEWIIMVHTSPIIWPIIKGQFNMLSCVFCVLLFQSQNWMRLWSYCGVMACMMVYQPPEQKRINVAQSRLSIVHLAAHQSENKPHGTLRILWLCGCFIMQQSAIFPLSEESSRQSHEL